MREKTAKPCTTEVQQLLMGRLVPFTPKRAERTLVQDPCSIAGRTHTFECGLPRNHDGNHQSHLACEMLRGH